MDLKAAILQEHSRAQTDKIVHYVGRDRKRFAELVNLFLVGPYRVTQRAGWPMGYCVERHPELITPHLRTILDNLAKSGIHDSVKRNTIRLLQFIEIPKRFHGRVADICFKFLQNRKEPVAVRCFSLSVLGAIAALNPDLKQELALIIQDELPYATPGFAARAKRVLHSLKGVTS